MLCVVCMKTRIYVKCQNICKVFFLLEFVFNELINLLSELLKLFKTGEIINWRSLVIHFENDLKVGKETLPATNAFKDSDGLKRWNDFKTRIVEHVIRIELRR